VIGQELAVEQFEAADLQPRDQMRERDLGCIARAAEHALAEKGRAQPHAIQPANYLAVLPGLDRMRIAAPVELGISDLDIGIDPGIRTTRGRLRAMRDDFAEGAVDGDGIAIRPDRLGKRVRKMESVERQHTALLGFDPKDIVGIARARHREYPDRVSAQQQIRIERDHRA